MDQINVEEWYKPRPKTPRFKPCICGYNRRKVISYYGRIGYVCNNCGLMSPTGYSHERARDNWNWIIENKDAEKRYYPIENPYRYIPKKTISEESGHENGHEENNEA